MTGTGELLKFNLKRASRRIAIWAAAIGVVYLYCVFALGAMFDTTEAQQQRAALATTPASILMAGPGYGVDNYTLGPMLAHELMLWFIIALGIMSALLAVQLTRADEETGRAELTRSAVVSRFAPLIAAALTVLIANIAIAAVSLIALLAGGLPLTDSLAYVSAVALGAMAFGAVALLAANLTEHSRGASGLAIGVLVAAVLLRGIGDMTGRSRTPPQHGSALSWLSPIGWLQQMRIYVDLRWWPALLALALSAALLAAAARLTARRDFGAGLIRPRPGRAEAARALNSPLALAWRQQRTAALWWAVGFAVMFTSFGTYVDSVGDGLAELIAQNPAVGNIFNPVDLIGSFAHIILLMGAITAAAFGLSALARARTEESDGRAEYLLAHPVSRRGWLGAQVGVPLLVAAGLMLLAGAFVWVGATTVGVFDPGLLKYLGTAAAWVPAIALIVSFAAALFAWAPRFMPLAWAFIGWGFLAGVFGQALDLPEWALGIAPFHWIPNPMATGTTNYWPLVWLTLLSVGMIAVAQIGFRRRDIPG